MREVRPQFGSQFFFSAMAFHVSEPRLPHLQHGLITEHSRIWWGSKSSYPLFSKSIIFPPILKLTWPVFWSHGCYLEGLEVLAGLPGQHLQALCSLRCNSWGLEPVFPPYSLGTCSSWSTESNTDTQRGARWLWTGRKSKQTPALTSRSWQTAIYAGRNCREGRGSEMVG